MGIQRCDAFAEELKRRADRVSSLILYSDMPWIDIAIEVENLKEWCREQAPEKGDLFERIYVSRFNRLWRQWRAPEDVGSF